MTLSRPGAEPLSGSRTVLDAYSNDAAEFAERQRPGRYIILELDEDDALAVGAYNQTFTRFHNLTSAYEVRQVMDVGNVPARPEIVIFNTGVRTPIVIIDWLFTQRATART